MRRKNHAHAYFRMKYHVRVRKYARGPIRFRKRRLRFEAGKSVNVRRKTRNFLFDVDILDFCVLVPTLPTEILP